MKMLFLKHTLQQAISEHTNEYYTSVTNATFILYTVVYVSGRHVWT